MTWAPWSFMSTPTWFVRTPTWTTIALPVYVARRRMMKMEPPVIYLPEAVVEPVRAHLEAVQPDRSRAAALYAVAGQAGRRVRAVARTRGHRLGHDPYGALAGLRGLGAAAETEARVSGPARAIRSAIFGWAARK